MADEYVRSPLSLPSVESTEAAHAHTKSGRPPLDTADGPLKKDVEANESLLLERRGGCRDQEEENLPQVLVPRYRP